MSTSDKDTYRIWSDRVKVAKEYHRRFMLDPIEKIERVWRGEERSHWSSRDLEWINVNLTYANSKLVPPQIWFANPEIIVEPLTDRIEETDMMGQPVPIDVVRNAELVKPVLEQKLEQIKFKPEMQKVVRDAYLFGIGVMKEGWGSQYGKIGQKPIAKAKNDEPSGDNVQTTPITGLNMNIQPEQPWFLRVHPRDILLPSWARSYDEMEFVVHKILRRVSDVKSDTRYKNVENLEGTRRSHDNTSDGQRGGNWDEQEEFVEIWEIHYRTAAKKDDPMDREYEPGTTMFKIVVLAEGHNEILYHEVDEIAMTVGHFPFRFLVYSEDPDRIYPNSDVLQTIDLQQEICILRSYNLEVVKRQPAKTLVGASGCSDPKQEEQLQQNVPLSFVKVNDPNQFKVLEYPSISQDNYALQDRMMGDFRIISGVGENQQGSAAADTATEASIIQNNLGIRTGAMLDATKDCAIGCFYDLFCLLTEFAEEREIVRIDGPEGAQWKGWTADDIRGRYRFKIDVTQMQPPNNNVRKKMAFDFLNVALAPNSQQFFNVPEVIRQVAKTFTDVFPNVDALLRDQAAANQAEEILAMMNGQEVPVEPWHPHAEHLVLLERTMQSPAFALMPPEAQALIQQHAMQHQQLLQQTARGSGKSPAGMTAPQEGVGAVPAQIANRVPTEGSMMAGANGGRMPQGM